jgi:hypothetical protein
MSNININKEFHEFGKFIQIVAILTIVSLAAGLTGFIALIFIFIAMGCIKRANCTLNNSLLSEFRSKYIRGFILRICGMAVLITGGVSLGLFFFKTTPYPLYISLTLSLILLIAGLVFIYSGVAAEMNAWKNLKIFFENNSKMFPATISNEAIKGCDKLKTGILLSALGFLIVPAIIGFIFQVKGYFMLATLNKISLEDTPKSLVEEKNLPEPQPISDLEPKIKFCPNCGAELSGLGRFCALCGSQIS